ncbi:MAG TPA: adenosine deaminase [Actinomycetota bacterium]|nr:adenosine deaminase [Actinomycetota bacterium]
MAVRASALGLRDLPKVELHVHLGGTITVDLALELARRRRTRLAALRDGGYPRRYGDFAAFLRTYVAVNDLVRTPEDLFLVASAFAGEQARLGVRYTEATFTAMTYVRGGIPPPELWAALREGFVEGGGDVDVRLIVDVIRDFGEDEAAATVRLVEAADAPIVALGLTGIEGSVPLERFRPLRQAADRLGLGLVVHAGETGPASSVRQTLDVLAPDRIAHGVAAAREPALVARLAAQGTPLDVCLTSNVATGMFRSLDEHPFGSLWRAGVRLTVSTDDPPFFGTTLEEELGHAARIVGLDRSEVAALQRGALEASFAPQAVRHEVRAAIDRWDERPR